MPSDSSPDEFRRPSRNVQSWIATSDLPTVTYEWKRSALKEGSPRRRHLERDRGHATASPDHRCCGTLGWGRIVWGGGDRRWRRRRPTTWWWSAAVRPG